MDKERIYQDASDQIVAVLEGETDLVSRMSSICAILYSSLPDLSWIGFYRVIADRLLAVGPYQGKLGCLRIAYDSGVCGAAARSCETQIVEDVSRFPGHIACDPAARSEIVVPVRDRGGHLIAVLDLDSHRASAFDTIDREQLERIVTLVAP